MWRCCGSPWSGKHNLVTAVEGLCFPPEKRRLKWGDYVFDSGKNLSHCEKDSLCVTRSGECQIWSDSYKTGKPTCWISLSMPIEANKPCQTFQKKGDCHIHWSTRSRRTSTPVTMLRYPDGLRSPICYCTKSQDHNKAYPIWTVRPVYSNQLTRPKATEPISIGYDNSWSDPKKVQILKTRLGKLARSVKSIFILTWKKQTTCDER